MPTELDELRAQLAKVTAERDALLAVLDFHNHTAVQEDSRRSVSDYMLAFNLTRLEGMMLDLLVRSPLSVSWDDFRLHVWGGRAVTQKAIGQRIHFLRVRLLPYDVAVGMLRGKGYGLRQRSKERIKAHLAAWRASSHASPPKVHPIDEAKRQCSG